MSTDIYISSISVNVVAIGAKTLFPYVRWAIYYFHSWNYFTSLEISQTVLPIVQHFSTPNLKSAIRTNSVLMDTHSPSWVKKSNFVCFGWVCCSNSNYWTKSQQSIELWLLLLEVKSKLTFFLGHNENSCILTCLFRAQLSWLCLLWILLYGCHSSLTR